MMIHYFFKEDFINNVPRNTSARASEVFLGAINVN